MNDTLYFFKQSWLQPTTGPSKFFYCDSRIKRNVQLRLVDFDMVRVCLSDGAKDKSTCYTALPDLIGLFIMKILRFL